MPDSETPEHRDASLDEVGSWIRCCRQLSDGSSEHRESTDPEGDEQAVLGAEQGVHGAGGSPHIIGEPANGQPFQAGRLNGSLGCFEQRGGGCLVVFPRPSHLDMISQHCYVTAYRNNAPQQEDGNIMEMARAPAAGPGTAQVATDMATRTLAGLAADDYGNSDDRAPLVLLHGLTFDRSTVAALAGRVVPHRPRPAGPRARPARSRRIPGWPSYDIQSLAHGVHRAVEEAGLQSPVVVGHSIAAIIATAYAAQYPTRGIINVDQPLQVAPFAALVQSLAGKLRGPAFPAVWQMFAASMHIELLPEAAQELVRSSCQPRQDLVLAYWREILDRPVSELTDFAAATLEAVRSAGVPYLYVAGADLEPEYEKWLSKTLPQAAVTVWPGSGHFPHIAYPGRFAECLAATAHPSAQTQANQQSA